MSTMFGMQEGDSGEPTRDVNPFLGLRHFGFPDNYLFFGRDGQSEELLRKLSKTRFVAVVGTSGSGKSSLIHAGLLPSLHAGFMQAGSNWRVALFRPGHDPIGNLAHALNASRQPGSQDEGSADMEAMFNEVTLRRSSLGLVEYARRLKTQPFENLLVVVDQFEELFRFRALDADPGDAAAAFVKLLLEAARQSEFPIYVVITMRSDYLGDCARFWDLPEAINEGQYLVPRMTREERRQAITGPVKVAGGEITPRLVNQLLNDMGDSPDQLPIMQHALMRTWDFWREQGLDGPLDLSDYEAIGGMSEALSLHADEAFNELTDERSRIIAEKIFKALTEESADGREYRRPTRLRDICEMTEATREDVVAVIESFRRPGCSFLMPPPSTPLEDETIIDISHESLIRGWSRLRYWVHEEAESARIYKRLADTAVLHREGLASLWGNPELHFALEWRERARLNRTWAGRYHSAEFDLAMNFLHESREAEKMREKEEVTARLRELKKAVRMRWLMVASNVLLLVAIGTAIYAMRAREEARANERATIAAMAEADKQRKRAEEALREAEDARERLERIMAQKSSGKGD
jgi:energy-coupling factor transporter ATP-binding protein EcfA2